MKKNILRKVSAFVSMAMTVSMLTVPKLSSEIVNADSSDMKYAISQMSKFVTITNGNFTNTNHTMGPIACGGDFSGNMTFQDSGAGYFGRGGYDLVIKGSAENASFGFWKEYAYRTAGYEDNGFDYLNSQKDWATTINGYNQTDIYGDWQTTGIGNAAFFNISHEEAFPVDFAAIDRGMKEWSKMVNDYCNKEVTPANVISVKASGDVYTNLELDGEDPKVNIFNVDMNGSQIVSSFKLNIPSGSKAIINVKGTSFALQGVVALTEKDSLQIMTSLSSRRAFLEEVDSDDIMITKTKAGTEWVFGGIMLGWSHNF